MSAQSDEQLVSNLMLGLDEAFASIYERYKRNIYSFCLMLSSDRFLAEDATQDTFIKMQQNIHKLNDVSVFRSWLYTIARNQVYKLLQKRNQMAGSRTNLFGRITILMLRWKYHRSVK